MGFDSRDIRTMMDVFTSDNVYLGTILRVMPGSGAGLPEPRVAEDARQSSSVNGELLGPMPTQPIGNPGPVSQSAGARYATDPDAQPLGNGAMIVGKWWGLAGKRIIPFDAIQTVSLERVVLHMRKSELDRARSSEGHPPTSLYRQLL